MEWTPNKEVLAASARMVDQQATENPDLGIPADPDVADHMGAFEEHAITAEDLEYWLREVGR